MHWVPFFNVAVALTSIMMLTEPFFAEMKTIFAEISVLTQTQARERRSSSAHRASLCQLTLSSVFTVPDHPLI